MGVLELRPLTVFVFGIAPRLQPESSRGRLQCLSQQAFLRPSPRRSFSLWTAIGALGLAAAVAIIYRSAAASYLFNDDFDWLGSAPTFRLGNVIHLDRYSHFYRPVIEIYFHIGWELFGCNPFAFHALNIGIHLLNTLLLFLFARALTGRLSFAGLTALLFCVQPGYTEAVAWVSAVSELLPAAWFLLTLWLHLAFLRGRGAQFYVLSLVTFVACLLTHETSAALLPMMIALDVTLAWSFDWRRALRYAPFALFLAGYLVIETVVNSRSYVVQEGHYAFGWHAVPHALQYVVSLYVGPSRVASYYLVAASAAALVWFGDSRLRLFVVWIFVTLAPVSFFTWGNESRYLYLPAAGFALLLAELLLKSELRLATWVSAPVARTGLILAVAILALRFGVFAEKGSQDYRRRTLVYERYSAAVRDAAALSGGHEITVAPETVAGFPERYRDAAAQVALCESGIHVVVR